MFIGISPSLAGTIAAAFGASTAALAAIYSGTSTYNSITVGDGWWLDVTIPNVTAGGTLTLDPDGTPKLTIPVTSPGYDASGNLGTIARTVIGVKRIAKSYPNDAQAIEVQSGSDVVAAVALSEYIYSGDTVGVGTLAADAYTGSAAASLTVTNNSTVAYPKVIADWACVPKRDWTGDLTLEVVALHKFGQQTLPVRCVKIVGTDGTNTVTKWTTYEKSTDYGDNLPLWRVSFNVSEFTAGADVTFNFYAYPWVGDATAVRDSTGGTFPSVTAVAPQVYRCGAISSLKYAYVLTTGNDGTGAVDTTRAGAKATPYLTVAAALAGMFAAKSDLSQCVLYVGAGTFTWPTANIAGTPKTAANGWLRIEGDPDDADPYNNCIVQTGGATYPQITNNAAGTMAWIQLKNLSCTIAVGAQGLLSGNTGRATLWMDNVKLTNSLTANTAWCSGCYNYFTQVNGQGPNANTRVMQLNSTNIRPQLIRGCTTNRPLSANVLLSSTVSDCSNSGAFSLGDATNLRSSNVIAHNIKVFNYSAGTGGITIPLTSGKYLDIALSQVLFEGSAATIQPMLAMGENEASDTENVLIEYLTSCGGAGGGTDVAMRMNIHNDPTTVPTTTVSDQASYKEFTLRNSLLKWAAIKDDHYHGANEADTGAQYLVQGWQKRYGVGFRSNTSAYSPDEWAPEYFGIGSARSQAATFVDAAADNYKPTAGFAVCAVQSLKYDLNGVTRRTDGTGACGALES